MQTLKRAMVIQIVLFVFFYFFGLDYILKELVFFTKLFNILKYVFYGLIIIGGVVWHYLTDKDKIIVVDNKFISQTKIVLYFIAGTLFLSIGSVFFENFENLSKYLLIFSGGVMCLASVYGLYITIKALISGSSNSKR